MNRTARKVDKFITLAVEQVSINLKGFCEHSGNTLDLNKIISGRSLNILKFNNISKHHIGQRKNQIQNYKLF